MEARIESKRETIQDSVADLYIINTNTNDEVRLGIINGDFENEDDLYICPVNPDAEDDLLVRLDDVLIYGKYNEFKSKVGENDFQMFLSQSDFSIDLKEYYEDEKYANKKFVSANKLHWYEMVKRPISIGSQPKGFVEFDEDKGRYGIVAYENELTDKELNDYEMYSWNHEKQVPSSKEIFVGSGEVYIIEGIELDAEADYFSSGYFTKEMYAEIEKLILDNKTEPLRSKDGYISVRGNDERVIYQRETGYIGHISDFQSVKKPDKTNSITNMRIAPMWEVEDVLYHYSDKERAQLVGSQNIDLKWIVMDEDYFIGTSQFKKNFAYGVYEDEVNALEHAANGKSGINNEMFNSKSKKGESTELER